MANETLKDRELQAHYDALFSMFGSDGWKAFVEQARAHAVAIADIRNIGNKSLDYRLGQIDVYDWFLAYQRMNEDAYTMMIDDENGEIDDDPSV